MSVEIEAKMSVPSLDAVRLKLESLAAHPIGEFFELNSFFDTEDRSLLAADQGLRLRVNRDAHVGTEQYVLTFKGPRLHGQLKSREERELSVGNAKDAERFLGALGYQRVLAFEKRRHKWKYNGCTIELDELPHIGLFVEIEGPDEATIFQVRDALGLGKTPIIKTSYIAMLMAWLQDHGGANGGVIKFKS